MWAPRQFNRVVRALRREGADVARRGRPWGIPLGDRVLLVAAYWRTNLTLRQLAPLFGVSLVRSRPHRQACRAPSRVPAPEAVSQGRRAHRGGHFGPHPRPCGGGAVQELPVGHRRNSLVRGYAPMRKDRFPRRPVDFPTVQAGRWDRGSGVASDPRGVDDVPPHVESLGLVSEVLGSSADVLVSLDKVVCPLRDDAGERPVAFTAPVRDAPVRTVQLRRGVVASLHHSRVSRLRKVRNPHSASSYGIPGSTSVAVSSSPARPRYTRRRAPDIESGTKSSCVSTVTLHGHPNHLFLPELAYCVTNSGILFSQ